MDHFVAAFIALMPFLAMAPLAIGAVAIVALLVSPALRAAVGEWARRRLVGGGTPAPAPAEGDAGEVEALRAAVASLEDRVGLLERVLVAGAGETRDRGLGTGER